MRKQEFEYRERIKLENKQREKEHDLEVRKQRLSSISGALSITGGGQFVSAF